MLEINIREWKIEDAKDLSLVLSNPKVLGNLRDGIPYPYTENDAKEYIQSMISSDRNSTFAFAIVCNNKVIGSIGAFRQNNIHYRTAELGYYLSQEYWGRGIMTEAVKMFCNKIFEETDIIRIFAEPFSHNTGSRKVLEKSGFTLEGILKSNAYKNGEVIDMTMYSLVKQ